jgi:hypothetical protein
MDCVQSGTCNATNQTAANALLACAQSACATPCSAGGTVVDPTCTPPTTPPSGGSCVTIDGTTNKCNPVTNAGCNAAAGEACDFGGGGFKCYAPPPANSAALCATCDVTNGPACQPTGTCVKTASGTGCARFCCTDVDCAPGKCDTSVTGHSAGICVN